MRHPPHGDPGADRPTSVWGAPPVLVVTSQGELYGRQFPLAGAEVTIGRSADNLVCLQDPYVSRHHARVRAMQQALVVEDAGSTVGVFVNGRRIDRPTSLQPGDVIRLGRLDLQLQPDPAASVAGPPGPPGAVAPPPVSFDVDSQRAGVIHNIGGSYSAHYDYGLKIAPMRRRARVVLRLGIAVFLAGMAVYGYAVFQGVLNVFGKLGGSPDPSEPPDLGEVFEPVIRYAPVGLVLLFAGVVLIVTGLLMRRGARAKEQGR